MRVRFIKEFDKRGSIIQIKIYKLKETKIKKNYESNYDCHFNYIYGATPRKFNDLTRRKKFLNTIILLQLYMLV